MKYLIITAALVAATKFIVPVINDQVNDAAEQQKQHMTQLVQN